MRDFNLTELLPIIGAMTIVYAVARLIHYGYLKFEDSNTHVVLQRILIAIFFLLCFLSFPVAIVYGWLHKLHSDRLYDKASKESLVRGYEAGERIGKTDVQKAYQDGYDKGLQNGRNSIPRVELTRVRDISFDHGYQKGYKTGYQDCLRNHSLEEESL